MEDDLNIFLLEDDLKKEDNLKFLENGRRTPKK